MKTDRSFFGFEVFAEFFVRNSTAGFHVKLLFRIYNSEVVKLDFKSSFIELVNFACAIKGGKVMLSTLGFKVGSQTLCTELPN